MKKTCLLFIIFSFQAYGLFSCSGAGAPESIDPVAYKAMLVAIQNAHPASISPLFNALAPICISPSSGVELFAPRIPRADTTQIYATSKLHGDPDQARIQAYTANILAVATRTPATDTFCVENSGYGITIHSEDWDKYANGESFRTTDEFNIVEVHHTASDKRFTTHVPEGPFDDGATIKTYFVAEAKAKELLFTVQINKDGVTLSKPLETPHPNCDLFFQTHPYPSTSAHFWFPEQQK